MLRKDVIFDSAYIANHLKLRQSTRHKTVLVLGSRCSGLFRSNYLYETLQTYGGSPTFSTSPRLKQFRECYQILTRRDGLSRSEIQSVLMRALDEVNCSTADLCLAELVKLGLFDLIISTQVDTLFEQALKEISMKELRDFEIFCPRGDMQEDASVPQPVTPCQLIKVFGQLTSEYAVPRTSYLLHRPRLAGSLQYNLQRDVLVLGLDPLWDAELNRVLSSQGGSLWFINEEPLPEDGDLYHIGQGRQARTIENYNGRYERFVPALYWQLMGNLPLHDRLGEILMKEIQILSSEIRTLQKEVRDCCKPSSSP